MVSASGCAAAVGRELSRRRQRGRSLPWEGDVMTQIAAQTAARPLIPPLSRGLPLILLCAVAFGYAYVAIPTALLPQKGFLNAAAVPAGNDFFAFYSAALLVSRHATADLFDLTRLFAFQDAFSGTATHLPYPYPPHFLLLLAPLASLPYLPALYVWIVVTATPFALIVKKLSGLAAPLIFIAPPLVQNAIDGQTGALAASLFAGGLLLLANRRSALAGIVFGLLTFKPQVFMLIPICLLAARQYRALAWLTVTGVTLFCVSVAVLGVDIWWKFLAYLPQQMSFVYQGRFHVARCPTVFVMIFHATGNTTFAEIMQAISTLAAWALVGWSWRRTSAIFPRALAFCVAMPLSTPYMLEYDLVVWTLPAAILMMRCWRGEGQAPDWAALTVLWLLPPVAWLMSQADVNFSSLVVMALAPYVVWTVRREPSLQAFGQAKNTVGSAAVSA
jgi:alpha-1,2-mannosyltransferase